MKNEILHYMIDIGSQSGTIYLIEGKISISEFMEELQNSPDSAKPLRLQREANLKENINRLHTALDKAVNYFLGTKISDGTKTCKEYIYQFPLEEGKLQTEKDLIEYIDEIF